MAEQQGLQLQQERICLDVIAVGTEITETAYRQKTCKVFFTGREMSQK